MSSEFEGGFKDRIESMKSLKSDLKSFGIPTRRHRKSPMYFKLPLSGNYKLLIGHSENITTTVLFYHSWFKGGRDLNLSPTGDSKENWGGIVGPLASYSCDSSST